MIKRMIFRPSRLTGVLARASTGVSSRPILQSYQPTVTSLRAASPRCYSATATENSKGPESEATKTGQETPEEDDPMKKELETKSREIIDLKDKYLRSVADFRNLQERTKRDIQSAKDFAIQRFAKDLIESIDNLDRALSTVPPEKLKPNAEDTEGPTRDLLNLHDGLKMTETILMQTLKKHGLERFDPSEKGEKFNPNLHEATFFSPVEGKEDGTVFHTQQKGFLLNGRVLRAAKVGIVKQ
ncbi:MAG: Mitochondrial matrix cochaperone [Trichoglossum hirsutum]|nr:MAG: Mitochondrial matrix cochaperone [Trichoglossum hirsutum]